MDPHATSCSDIGTNIAPVKQLFLHLHEDVQKHIDREILRANANKLQDLEDQLQGKKEVRVAKLEVKRKVLWSKGVKRLPERLLKAFCEVALKPEVEEDTPPKRRMVGSSMHNDIGYAEESPIASKIA